MKYRFTKEHAILAKRKIQPLETKRYLDRSGVIKTVKKIIIAPWDGNLLKSFLSEPDLFSDYDEILERYPASAYGILLFMESSTLYIHHLTIEGFEIEFGLHSSIMEMVIGLSESKHK
jgi:hypothetical protein